MTSLKGKSFYAKATKGYVPKTAFDALATNLGRITLRLTKKGIFIREADCENVEYSHVLWDVVWPRKKFALFRCTTEAVVTLNIKHLQKMLRNVKKKDSIAFFIEKATLKNPDLKNRLGIVIQSAGAQTDGPARRAETVYINIRYVETVLPFLPDFYIDPDTNEQCSTYGNPMVIAATDFQKIKKMSGCASTLLIEMQKSNYISFDAGDKNVMCSKLEFGEKTMNPDE